MNNRWFYGAIGLDANILVLPDATMHFDNEHPTPYNDYEGNEKKYGFTYQEFMHSNVGLNINKNISVFCVGAFGVFTQGPSKFMIRYGVGAQYKNTIKDKDFSELGVRLSYLTGATNLSSTDFKHQRDANPNVTNIPKQINSFNLTFFIRGTL